MFFTYINRRHRSAISGLEIAHAWVWQKTRQRGKRERNCRLPGTKSIWLGRNQAARSRPATGQGEPLRYCCPTHRHRLSATLLDGRAGNGWARLSRCGRDRSDGGFPNAGYEPASVMRRLSFNCSEPAKKSGQNIPKNRCGATIAERMGETPAELPFMGDQVVCLSHNQARQHRAEEGGA
jgi:hypothetical protein